MGRILALLALVACAHSQPVPSKPLPQRILDSTVLIETEWGHGSGFALEVNRIATAYHVVEDASSIEISTRGGDMCEVVGVDPDPINDLAVITVNGCGSLVPISARSEAVEGTHVYAAGMPGRARWAVTDGIVADADYPGGHVYITAIINPGISGGPVVDDAGRLVGVAVALITADGMWGGVGLARPSRLLD